ncbi:MAG: hypothetical protein Q9200_001443 [Gallowayella weberi]
MTLFTIPHHSSRGVKERSSVAPEDKRDSKGFGMLCHIRKRKRLEEDGEEVFYNKGFPSSTFQALATFFDLIACERMPPAKVREGCFPTEIYAVIIESVFDIPTRHAFMEVSRTFRDLCSRSLIIGSDMLLQASETTKSLETSQGGLKWDLTNITRTGVKLKVTLENEATYYHFDKKKLGNRGSLRLIRESI